MADYIILNCTHKLKLEHTNSPPRRTCTIRVYVKVHVHGRSMCVKAHDCTPYQCTRRLTLGMARMLKRFLMSLSMVTARFLMEGRQLQSSTSARPSTARRHAALLATRSAVAFVSPGRPSSRRAPRSLLPLPLRSCHSRIMHPDRG